MSSYLRIDDFIESVKKRATVPTSQITFTDDDIIRFANEDMDENMTPLVMSVREEFYVTDAELTPEEVGNNEKRVEVPERAFGSKVRLVSPINGGITQQPLSVLPLEHVAFRDFSPGVMQSR
jgi:hypothetical protein